MKFSKSKSSNSKAQLEILYEDDNICVINKPSGLAVQGGTNTSRHIDGLLEALKFEYAESK